MSEREEFWHEIMELEIEATDPYARQSTRHICALKAKLLRAGYRVQAEPTDSRLLNIVELASGEIIERVTPLQLTFDQVWFGEFLARFSKSKTVLRTRNEDGQ